VSVIVHNVYTGDLPIFYISTLYNVTLYGGEDASQ